MRTRAASWPAWPVLALSLVFALLSVPLHWPAAPSAVLLGVPQIAAVFPLAALAFGAVGIAILGHRLYDIDIIINRALVYGAFTAMLALVYFGAVTAIQALLRDGTGQQELPQLVVLALFDHLRRRVQSFIDRSFYRRKYDARKTLEIRLVPELRRERLEALNDEPVGAVRETMQPVHVSVWLRPVAELGLSTESA